MTHKSFRSLVCSIHASTLCTVLAFFPLLSATAELSAAGFCDSALPLSLPGTETGYAAGGGIAMYTVDVERSGWLLIEAQALSSAADGLLHERPIVRLFDARCRRVDHHPTLARRLGRHLSSARPGRHFIQIDTRHTVADYRIDSWLSAAEHSAAELSAADERRPPAHDLPVKNGDEEPNPAPQEPVDEWEELNGGKPGRANGDEEPNPAPQEPVDEWEELNGGKPGRANGDEEPNPAPQEPVDEWEELNGDTDCRPQGVDWSKNGDEEPNPVPQEPVDEWEELGRGSGPCPTGSAADTLEVQGAGVMVSTDSDTVFHSWCPWSSRPELLGTLTCARRLQFQDSDSTLLHSMELDRPEIFTLDLERVTQIRITGGRLAAVYDHRGRRVEVWGDSVKLTAGRYFLGVTDIDPIYRIDVTH